MYSRRDFLKGIGVGISVSAFSLSHLKHAFADTGDSSLGRIGMNFGPSVTQLDSTEIAGVPEFEQSNWNSGTVSAGTLNDLVDSLGVATTMSVIWSSKSSFASDEEDSDTPNNKLMRGYLDNRPDDANKTLVTITGIPYDNYALVIYREGQNKTNDRNGKYTVSNPDDNSVIAGPYYAQDPANSSFDGVFVQAPLNTTIDDATTPSGNYFLIEGISASSIQIEAIGAWRSDAAQNARAAFNAFQIIELAPIEQAEPQNLLYIFADQWRAQAMGYAGNTDVTTPNLDQFAAESVNYVNAVSNIPVCCPHRASLITGQFPMTHGLILNDLELNTNATSIADAYNQAGYKTGHIGKWHMDGNGRSTYIPPERRQGFQYFKALECTHNYNNSKYYDNDDTSIKTWSGYDAYAQKDDAVSYLLQRAGDQVPFALFLSWGSPHAPYNTAPEAIREKYDNLKDTIQLRDNVPADKESAARTDIAGYYAHIESLDIAFGELMETLRTTGLDQNTIVVFTSDHGDMLYSHSARKKQQPWDESCRVPFLIRSPQGAPKTIQPPISTPDIMPTLLGLCQISIPQSCEGEDLSDEILGNVEPPQDRPALLTCPIPFGQWSSGYEYRGVRTKRYTYVRDLNGPKMLFDNQTDPYQMNNLVNQSSVAALQDELERQLRLLLFRTCDPFESRTQILARTGYKVNSSWTVQYTDSSYWGQVSQPCTDCDMVKNPCDVSGSDGQPDGFVDGYDLAEFARNWLSY